MIKRVLDVILSALGLLLLSPAFVLVAIAVKLDSPGPVFYRGRRIGRNGRPFVIYKFRSMYHGWAGPSRGITGKDDPRVTRLGRLLRSLRIDEWPQLVNVLKGEMSIVGPRPEAPAYVALYTPEQRQVLSVRPGILGPGQRAFRNETELLDGDDFEQSYARFILPRKLAVDLAYVHNQSLLTDLKIVLGTLADLIVEFFGTRLSLRGRHLLLIDALAVALSYVLSFAIRFDMEQFSEQFALYWFIAFLFLVIRLPVYYRFGLYRRVWRYASVSELVLVASAVTLGTIILALLLLVSSSPGGLYLTPGFPRSVIAIDWLLNLGLIGGVRFAFRAVSEAGHRAEINARGYAAARKRRAVVVGANETGAAIVREMHNNPALEMIPVGFVDPEGGNVDLRLHGVPVLGSPADLPRIVSEQAADVVIIAIPNAPGKLVRGIIKTCEDAKVAFKIVPAVGEIISGAVSIERMREVRIEDLLRREPATVDISEIAAYLTGSRVLVTGAGGSIGSELCRQIAGYKPAQLLALGHGENSIFSIVRELTLLYPSLEVVPIIADIKDRYRIDAVIDRHRPDVIFHAAAHKHVPLMEQNVEEVVTNNIFGTSVVAEAAAKFGVKRFVLISTDKAVNPTSVMGASKRVAEMVIQDMGRRSKTIFVAVRFGNVLGSRGSVIPLFQEQIARGGPVTVTHPEIARYFMTIPEAVQLVIQAAAFGEGGEVFVLDMGQLVKIVDLARDMIELAGLKVGRDIDIVFTGLRPGEKLREELFTTTEGLAATKHAKIFKAPLAPFDGDTLRRCLVDLAVLVQHGAADEIRCKLMEIVPEFQHQPVSGDGSAFAVSEPATPSA